MRRIRFLLAMLAFVGLSVNVNAQTTIVASGDCGDNGNNLTWILTSDSILTISGSGAMANFRPAWWWWDTTDAVIPWLDYQLDFNTVIINEGATYIGRYSLNGCYRVTSLVIPSTVDSIGVLQDTTMWNLTSVVCHAVSPPGLENYAFGWLLPLQFCTLYVPKGTKTLYEGSDWVNYFSNIEEFATTNLKLLDISFEDFNLQTGDEFSLIYTVESSTALDEEWTDVIYISTIPSWSIDAVEVARNKKRRNVAASSTYKDTVKCVIPNVIEGDYYVIVRCNAERTKVQEDDYSDNVLTAQDTIEVSVELLSVGAAAKEDTLLRGQQKMYKLPLANNKSIRISDSIGIVNIAVAHEQVPDISKARQGNNYISLSTAGNYYVLLSNNGLDTLQAQPYCVTATEIGIEISKVFVDTIVRYGAALIPVEVIGCSGIPQITLVDENNVHYPADTIYQVSEFLFVTQFQVDSLEVGDYSVYASCGSESDMKVNAIHLLDKNPYELLKTKIIMPSIVRSGSTVWAYVEYKNAGNFGVFPPNLMLTGVAGSTFKLDTGAVHNDKIYLTNLTNNMGIPYLYPGESGLVKVMIGIPNQQILSANYMLYILPDSTLGDSVNIDIVFSYDPNEKVGIKGVGDKDFVVPSALMLYTVFFENDAEKANAPAQEVRITDTLDDAFDLSTFAFTAVKVGSLDIPVKELAEETIITDLRPDNNLLLRTKLKMDIDTRIITVVFTSLDPQTGEFTNDPLAGFLPPNDETHAGEGHFSYRVNLKNDLQDNYEVENQANIYFDENEPIETNITSHFIDALPPISSVHALPLITNEDSILVSWNGTDAASGVKHYDIYVASERGPYTIWKSSTTETSAYFHGQINVLYSFYSIATDFVGHVEEEPSVVVSIKFEDRVGIEQLQIDNGQWKIYPNPTSNQLRITIEGEYHSPIQYSIYSVVGQVVMEGQFPSKGGEFSIDVSHLASVCIF